MSITLITGPMFSGKSEYLINEYLEKSKELEILCINYIDDNRYSNEEYLSSHNGKKIKCKKVKELNDIKNIEKYKYIIIDEGQFFKDLFDFCLLYKKKGITIIIGILSSTYKMTLFEQFKKILLISDTIIKLKSICYKCKDAADYTKKISGKDCEIEIGNDIYKPCCYNCFY